MLVVGPRAGRSDYARQEGQIAPQADKAVTPILRQGDCLTVSDELKPLYREARVLYE